MSSVMNKIADALTGHHNHTTNTTTNAAHPNATGALPAGNQAGGVGTNFAGTNYSATDNGALKEGAQVRDTGMNAARNDLNAAKSDINAAKNHTAAYDSYNHDKTGSNSHLGRDAALGAGALGAAGAGAMAAHHHHNTTTTTGMHSNNASALGSSSSTLGSASTGMHATTGMQTGVAANTMNRGVAHEHDGTMTRSEEHLLVGKEKVNVGQAVLNKYVTTEKVSTAVPIIREHAVIEREPITEANRVAGSINPDFKEARYEVNLMEERAVAEKEVVPIERVRLRKEVEQTQQYVEAELRKEHIELIDSTQNAALGGKQLGAGAATTSATGLGRNSIDNTTTNTSTAARNL